MKEKEIFTLGDARKLTAPKAFVTMLKPAGSSCNLDCSYCYYLDKAMQYGGRNAVMDDELLEMYILRAVQRNPDKEIILREKSAPFLCHQCTVRLYGILYTFPGGIFFL